MTEATKTKKLEMPIGNQKMIVYELTNLANGTTITFPFRTILAWGGLNETTADKPFGASVSGGTMTAIVSTTTDEYRVWGIGK